MNQLPETSDSLLIRVRDSGDLAAWEQFVAIYRPLIYRIGRRMGLQDSDAEDLSQRVLASVATAIQTWEKDPQKGTFRSWLNRVARNSLVSMLREKREAAIGGTAFLERSLTVEEAGDEIQRLIDQEDRRSRLRWAAAQIRDEFQEPTWKAFWMTTLGDSSIQEAAELLGISTGSVYAARSRIMRRMQDIAHLDATESDNTDSDNTDSDNTDSDNTGAAGAAGD